MTKSCNDLPASAMVKVYIENLQVRGQWSTAVQTRQLDERDDIFNKERRSSKAQKRDFAALKHPIVTYTIRRKRGSKTETL